MPAGEETSLVYLLYVIIATHHDIIKTGAYLALAGVFALLLSLVILSVISTYLLHRKPEKNRGRVTTEVLEYRPEDPTYPYQYSYLQTVHTETDPTLRKSGSSDNYAKPFKPGTGVSLSGHFLPTDEPLLELHREKVNSPQMSLRKSGNVSDQTTSELMSGYTFESSHGISQARGENSDSDDYEPINIQAHIGDRMDEYRSDVDGDYVSVDKDGKPLRL